MPEMNNPVHGSQPTYINPLHESAVQENSSPTSTIGQTALKEIKDAGSTLRGKAFEVREMSVKMGRAVGNFFSKTIPTFAKGFVSQNKVDHEQKREAIVAKLEARIAQQKDNPKAVKDINNIINKVMVMTDNELDDTAGVTTLVMGAYKNEGLAEQSAVNVVRKVTAAATTEQPSHLRKLSDKVAATFDKADFKPMTRLDRIGRAVRLNASKALGAITGLASKVMSAAAKSPSAPKTANLQGFINDSAKLTAPPKDHYKSEGYLKSMKGFLGQFKEAIGFKESDNKVKYEVMMGAQKGWKAEIDPNKTYKIGKSKISGARLLELQKETKVSVDTNNGGNPAQVAGILKNGSQNLQDRLMAGKKIVSSTEILMMGADDKPIAANDNSPTFKAYTVSAPNVAYDAEMKAHFSTPDGKLDVSKWKAEIKGILSHLMSLMKKDGVQVPVLPAMGLGAFMADASRKEAAEAFVEALLEAKGENDFQSVQLVGTQFDDISEDLKLRAIEQGISFAGGKDSFAILEAGLNNGMKMGVAVAGDPSGQAGQQVASTGGNPGHIAQEEAFAIKVPTFMLNQNYGANEAVGNSANYQTV